MQLVQPIRIVTVCASALRRFQPFSSMQAEDELAAAAAKKEFFTRALGDMRLVQSKVTRAVVEAQQR